MTFQLMNPYRCTALRPKDFSAVKKEGATAGQSVLTIDPLGFLSQKLFYSTEIQSERMAVSVQSSE